MSTRANRLIVIRVAVGIALAWVTSWVVLNGGFSLLRASWPQYALAHPGKTFTLTMLFVRLLIFSSMIAATSGVATLIAGDKRMAWIAGGVILAVSIPPHLYPGYVWNDYPAWYHIVYVLSILPLAYLGGRSVRRLFPAASRAASAVLPQV
jgi:hypothetical protein